MDKLDVLLINAPSPNPGEMLSHRLQGLPPLGLGYIATWLKQYNYKVKILDFYIRTVTIIKLKEILEEQHPILVGISTTTETYKSGIRIAGYIKSYDSSIVVFMGGYHVTFEYEAALKSGVVDFVVRNEGEITSKDICDYFIKQEGEFEKILGISYIKNGEVVSNPDRNFITNLDELPFPDRSLYDIDKYTVPSSISTSRGCPGRCIFCAATALSGGRYRVRSAENVIKEFKYLKSLGYKHVQIIDDTMTADIRRLNKFLDVLLEEKLDMTWNCESRVDIVTKELLQKMKSAGCKIIQFGVEAGNQEMLDCLKKNITLQQIHNVFNWCSELGIGSASCLIIGQPFDTFESIKDTINIASELQSLGAQVVFSISTPFPGTYMYNHPDELGLEIINYDTDDYTTQSPVYRTKNLTEVDIQNSFFDAYVRLGKENLNPTIRDKYLKIKDEVKKSKSSLGI